MKNLQRILKRDKSLKNEITEIIESGKNLPIAIRNNVNRLAIAKAMIGPAPELPRAEAMILLHMRPALLIKNNRVLLPDSAEMRNRIRPYIKKIEHTIPSVGRIEFLKAGRKFGGTGWMISEDTIVTNRHVASLVAEKKGRSFAFKKNPLGDTMQILIDFKEEYVGENVAATEFEVEIEKVVYMTEDRKTQPDIAFLRVKKNADLPGPILVTDKKVAEDQFVSVIGYPAYDPSGIISRMAAKDVFNNIYEVKRCSPGEVKENVENAWYFYHDCTTLGGNSGSVVIDNETGIAVGLHFMGEVEKENYAVKGSEVIKHFLKISPKYTFVSGTAAPKRPAEDDSGPVLEAAPESFDDRKGFDPNFLGRNKTVSLPEVVKNKTQVLSFDYKGKKTWELKYHHFSVVMNKKKRQCFFSACNIDGKESKRGVARAGWRYDSRIPQEFQIKDECYGGPPKFSRGHMTRKEDPIWGELELAKAACADTFHVTNATPQMQPFNAPVWLALENYALENARQDDMKICVITGPIFAEDDPVKYGIKIPVEFFKIIAFIHDKTKKLCATGYTVSQEDYLKNEEFVFGEFETYQVSIKSIETRTGLSFGNLSKVDPIKGQEAVGAPLVSVDEIKFI
jgi:endonuclease G